MQGTAKIIMQVGDLYRRFNNLKIVNSQKSLQKKKTELLAYDNLLSS